MSVSDKIPGNLEPVPSAYQWLDLVFKSVLSDAHKLVCVVISKSCTYSRKEHAQLGLITNYTISRVLHKNQEEVQDLLDDLLRLGWLCDTGERMGRKKMYALTINLLPEESKT